MIEVLLAIVGVVVGFSIGELFTIKKGFRQKRYKVKAEDLPKFLKEKFLADTFFLELKGLKVSEGVKSEEFDEVLKTIEQLKSKEIIMLNGEEVKYVANFPNAKVYVKAKFLSFQNFLEMWKVVKGAIT
ncbi:MAG: hypothetical protein NZ895_06695 [Archaeoglobaceae archaeon]|nr:hypothetical protein [Archaeoglobaceae archaeon]MCX8152257.1 hypothetical protein [Archaeoglobaceae archaeon]MDW8013935.1 hypothetical protein [Archaeoglobaceae archaeon]